MGESLRVMLINTTNSTTVKVTVTTKDAVEYVKLDPNPGIPANEPDGQTWGDKTGDWILTIGPGDVYGFTTTLPVDISNPNSAAVTIVTTNGKDPWPQPPPKSQLQHQIDDYPTRYQYFLPANGEPSAAPRQISLITIAPATKIPAHPATNKTTVRQSTDARQRKAQALLIAGYDPGRFGPTAPYAMIAVETVEQDLQLRFKQEVQVTKRMAPTAAVIVEDMRQLRAQLSPGDLFVVMFAGHGVDGVGNQLSQAWALQAQQRFTDDDLANNLPEARDQIDVAVISDCCYGEGVFTRGPTNAPLPPDEQEKKLFRQSKHLADALSQFWTTTGSHGVTPDATMVCIAGASANEQSAGNGTSTGDAVKQLALKVADAARTSKTYASLKSSFEPRVAGQYFYVDARPLERLEDRVLATTKD